MPKPKMQKVDNNLLVCSVRLLQQNMNIQKPMHQRKTAIRALMPKDTSANQSYYS
jgi:hypothetical protein